MSESSKKCSEWYVEDCFGKVTGDDKRIISRLRREIVFKKWYFRHAWKVTSHANILTRLNFMVFVFRVVFFGVRETDNEK